MNDLTMNQTDPYLGSGRFLVKPCWLAHGRALRRPVAWLSLDEGEATQHVSDLPRRVASDDSLSEVKGITSTIGVRARAALQSPQPAPTEAI